MNLFGQQLDGAMLMSVVSMVLLLVFWVFVLKRRKDGDRWVDQRLLEREREKQAARERIVAPARDDGVAPPVDPGKGPWG
ncbi:hypothetical protein [Brevundimonas lutea]|uniref:hypothetical protein n=1 Tax=Brevundimonas lutea TaxID=2293980 RepID=UPI000F041FE9|nr:hypothetical protein [Brevundimonas lutea]